MSVLKKDRNVGELEVLVKAEELAVYTLGILSNERVFPKRHRWYISSKIADCTIETVGKITEANAIRATDEIFYARRNLAQELAFANLEKLIVFVKIAHKSFNLTYDRVAFWTKNIVEVQKLIRAWQKSDKERFSNENKVND